MDTPALTQEQRRELDAAKKEAVEDMKAKDPKYMASMAGASFSGGIWEALFHLYGELETAWKAMPEEFSPSIDSNIPANVDSVATVYLATDALRPRAGWSFSAKKQAMGRELQRMMDARALMAALYLKQARMFRDYWRVGKR